MELQIVPLEVALVNSVTTERCLTVSRCLPIVAYDCSDVSKINSLPCDEGMFHDGYECVHTPAGMDSNHSCVVFVDDCCSLGYYSPLNSAVYYACPRGQYSLGGSSSCEVVPTGIYFD